MSERFFQRHTPTAVTVVWGSIAMFLLMSIDRITKSLALLIFTKPRVVIPSFLELRFVENDQLFFFQNIPPLVMIMMIICVMIMMIIFFIHAAHTQYRVVYAYGLLLIGAWSNLWDRIMYGAVIDFIHIPWWSTFNIADVMIISGVLLLFFWNKKKYEKISARH